MFTDQELRNYHAQIVQTIMRDPRYTIHCVMVQSCDESHVVEAMVAELMMSIVFAKQYKVEFEIVNCYYSSLLRLCIKETLDLFSLIYCSTLQYDEIAERVSEWQAQHDLRQDMLYN